MKPATEPCLQLLQRSYCYLRLGGLDSDDTCKRLRTLIDGLDDNQTAGDAGQWVWQQVRHWVDRQTVVQTPPSPDILRGTIRYPERQR